MDLDDHAATFRFLVRDRAGQFTTAFDSVLTGAGIATAKIPTRCPRATFRQVRAALLRETAEPVEGQPVGPVRDEGAAPVLDPEVAVVGEDPHAWGSVMRVTRSARPSPSATAAHQAAAVRSRWPRSSGGRSQRASGSDRPGPRRRGRREVSHSASLRRRASAGPAGCCGRDPGRPLRPVARPPPSRSRRSPRRRSSRRGRPPRRAL
jgi:hypothetical protein